MSQHSKDAFPTADVYGNTDAPVLRLITCEGDFDERARSYSDNVIVWAEYLGPVGEFASRISRPG